jgi:hypothetical protein
MTVSDALAVVGAAVAAAEAAPLSRKKAMLAALLLDVAIDAMFTASGEDDVLAFRDALANRTSALAPILELVAMNGATLVTEPVEIALIDYPALPVGDYMVSLYNGRTVPRVLIAGSDGSRRDAHEALLAALAALEVEATRT